MPIAQLEYEGLNPWGAKPAAKATAAYLLSKYASTRQASIAGSGMRPRGLSKPNDIPSLISAGTADPAGDATDPATRRINILNGYAYETAETIPPTTEDFSAPREYYRGLNEVLPAASYGSDVRVQIKINSLGVDGHWGQNTTIEPGASWGIFSNPTQLSFIYHGSVFYVREHWLATGFLLLVNGEVVVPTAIGGDITNPTGLPWVFQSPNGGRWIKVKFPTEARRIITVFQLDKTMAVTLKVPETSVIYGNPTRIRVGIFGDSFVGGTISDSSPSAISDAWANVFQAEYGLSVEQFNFGVGGSGFCGYGNNLIVPGIPTSEYVTGRKASSRKVLQLCTDGLDLDMIIHLGAHNDDYNIPLFKSEVQAFWKEAQELHPNAILIQAGTNASTPHISSGYDLLREDALASACAEIGIKHIPIQTGVSRLFSGTGNQSAPNGTGTTDVLTGPDGTHPTVAGHLAIGKFLADRVSEYLGEIV